MTVSRPPVKLVRLQAVTGSLYVNPEKVAAVMPDSRDHEMTRLFLDGSDEPFMLEMRLGSVLDLLAGSRDDRLCPICQLSVTGGEVCTDCQFEVLQRDPCRICQKPVQHEGADLCDACASMTDPVDA
jgi:hypothetical protein